MWQKSHGNTFFNIHLQIIKIVTNFLTLDGNSCNSKCIFIFKNSVSRFAVEVKVRRCHSSPSNWYWGRLSLFWSTCTGGGRAEGLNLTQRQSNVWRESPTSMGIPAQVVFFFQVDRSQVPPLCLLWQKRTFSRTNISLNTHAWLDKIGICK